MDICVDFDGTCVSHEFPMVGKEIGAASVLKELVKNGHRLILFTMRSNMTTDPIVRKEDSFHLKDNISKGNYLDHAVQWFENNNIRLYGVQFNPIQMEWTSSPKAYGQLYIDDAALGCPLIHNSDICGRPYVDWVKVRELLVLNGLIK